MKSQNNNIGLLRLIFASLVIIGHAPEMIAAHFPTLPLALVHKIIAFYLENQTETDAYMSEHEKEMDRQMVETPPAPTITELRARLAARTQAGSSHATVEH